MCISKARRFKHAFLISLLNGCHADVLFGLMKQVLRARPDLRLIITSATLDTSRFSAHFGGCPIYAVPGRLFPVEVLYATKDPKRFCTKLFAWPGVCVCAAFTHDGSVLQPKLLLLKCLLTLSR